MAAGEADRPATERERAEQIAAELKELVRAILQSTRDDEKSEQWTIRRFLEHRGVYDGNISGSRRLVALACQNALDWLSSLPSVRAEEPTTARECSCKGFCKGRDGLSSNYRCALDGKPGKVAALPPVQEPPKR